MTMKRLIAAFSLATLALSACTSLPDVKGPFARSAKGTTTQTDAGPDQVEQSPYPQSTDQGLF